MTDALLVIFDDQTAGTVTRLRGGRLRFDYTTRTESGPVARRYPCRCQSRFDHIQTRW
jgi:serine/threonine-protein kinase HipA